MNVHEARSLLGVGPDDGWDAVRLAYRRLIRELHPDRAGPAATSRAAELNEAYAVLSHALGGTTMRGRRPAPVRRPTATAPSPSPRITAHLDGPDRLVVDAPPDEAFTRLLEAGHAVGAVSYVDRSCAIFEVVVRHEGETHSLVVTLQARGAGTEAYCTLESIERVSSPSPEPLVRQLADALHSPWLSPPPH
ncbi:MAG: J domain-containing protein [Acidimicrobiales bacterium]